MATLKSQYPVIISSTVLPQAIRQADNSFYRYNAIFKIYDRVRLFPTAESTLQGSNRLSGRRFLLSITVGCGKVVNSFETFAQAQAYLIRIADTLDNTEQFIY